MLAGGLLGVKKLLQLLRGTIGYSQHVKLTFPVGYRSTANITLSAEKGPLFFPTGSQAKRFGHIRPPACKNPEQTRLGAVFRAGTPLNCLKPADASEWGTGDVADP